MKYLFLALMLVLAGCNTESSNNGGSSSAVTDQNGREDTYRETAQVFTDVTTMSVVNKGAYVPSQCYTKTEDGAGNKHNPCFSCHINSEEPNYVDDWDLQESYDFGEYTGTNRWTNLFKDRSEAVADISDETIAAYVQTDNYLDTNGNIILAGALTHLPGQWDNDDDGKWSGFIPDCYFHFDEEGLDRDAGGRYTGWRAFAYYPFLGTFWPTNGSTDDVLIRLPDVMRQNAAGTFDKRTYVLNLAIIEALIKRRDVMIDPVDEADFGVDLNQNGVYDTADTVVFRWVAPKYDFANKKYYDYSMYYVGRAKAAQIDNALHMAPGLYPEGTEFLHTVRYIDVDENGSTGIGTRMKELRYGKKTDWNTYPQLSNATQADIKEKDDFPDRLRTIVGNAERGLRTGLGWTYQGFIEDKDGFLRPQTYEETLNCIGCHSGIGAIADSTFAFPRKFDYAQTQHGWYHWSQYGMEGAAEPQLGDGRYEYELYLEANGAGDEFRENDEVMAKFFDANGSLIGSEAQKIRTDISYLLFPSAKRALELNKAYKVIVDEQSFIYGRDAHVQALENVHREVAPATSTNVTVIKR
jgi:hypothetical protein